MKRTTIRCFNNGVVAAIIYYRGVMNSQIYSTEITKK